MQPTMNMTKFRQQMKEIERELKKAQTQSQKPMRAPTPAGAGAPVGGSGRPRTPKTPQGREEEKARKAAEREAKAAARREDLGNLRLQNFNYRARAFSKASPGAMQEARDVMGKAVEQYKKGEITLQRMNQALAHQLDALRRSHREKNAEIEDEVRGRRRIRRELEAEAKMRIRMRNRELRDIERNRKRELAQQKRDRDRRYGQLKEGAAGLNPRMIASSLIGAGLFAGGSVVGNTLMNTNERIKLVSRGAENVQTNANSILAMTAWGEQNGVDSANIIKSIDNIKDVRERLGNTVLASKWNEKEGKWKGGDNGINDIMNLFGWNPEQLKPLQNDPLAFIQATVNEGERRGMNSAQIGRLLENLGDDLMHYQRMFSKNGEGYNEVLKMLQRTGATLTQEQIDASKEFTRFAATVQLVGQGMQNHFLEGFVKALPKDDSWLDNVKDTDPNKSLAQKAYEATQSGDSNPVADWLYNLTGIDTQDIGRMWRGEQTRTRAFGFGNPLEDLRQSAYTPNVSLARNQPVVENTVAIPSDLIKVTISPSSEFGNILDARIQNSGNSIFQRLSLSTLSGQSNTGG
ncbi:hypothetical protein [Escherichia phage vB_EcoM_EP57]|nr:hypothetical protein [Escherichia phage vB_EcoM_EP57]